MSVGELLIRVGKPHPLDQTKSIFEEEVLATFGYFVDLRHDGGSLRRPGVGTGKSSPNEGATQIPLDSERFESIGEVLSFIESELPVEQASAA